MESRQLSPLPLVAHTAAVHVHEEEVEELGGCPTLLHPQSEQDLRRRSALLATRSSLLATGSSLLATVEVSSADVEAEELAARGILLREREGRPTALASTRSTLLAPPCRHHTNGEQRWEPPHPQAYPCNVVPRVPMEEPCRLRTHLCDAVPPAPVEEPQEEPSVLVPVERERGIGSERERAVRLWRVTEKGGDRSWRGESRASGLREWERASGLVWGSGG